MDGRSLAAAVVASTRQLAAHFRADGRFRDALLVLEEGKALGLRRELVRFGRMPAGLSGEEQVAYRSAIENSRRIRAKHRELQYVKLSPDQRSVLLGELALFQDEANRFLRECDSRDPSFGLYPPGYKDLRLEARTHQLTIAYFHCTEDPSRGTEVYLIHPDSPDGELPAQDILSLQGLSRTELLRLLTASPKDMPLSWNGGQELIAPCQDGSPGWTIAYQLMKACSLVKNETIAHAALRAWLATMQAVLSKLGECLATPLAARLNQLGSKRVVFIPEGPLALFPLHAAPVIETCEAACYLGDRFVISYAPSGAALLRSLTLARMRESNEQPFFTALANPDGSLAFAGLEVDAASTLFNGRTREAHGSQATASWLVENGPEADHLLLATHACYIPGYPLESSILLAHPRGETWPWWDFEGHDMSALHDECAKLTLNDIWGGKLRLKSGCVVCAGACETGQIEPGAADEEHFGFPAAFLSCGASAVIASTWAVDDMSAAWLIDRAYRLMRGGQRLSPADALQQAARWLRGLSKRAVRSRLAALISRLEQERTAGLWEALADEELGARHYRLRVLEARLYGLESGEERPFADPVYWAAFSVTGA
jgi:CHAT domain-containing protein